MDDNAPPPGWIGLLVAGIANLLYGLGYLVWSLVAFLTSGIVSISAAIQALSSGSSEDLGAAIMLFVSACMPLISTIVFIVVPIMALVTIFAAIRFKSFRSKGLVWLGVVCAVGAPLLGLVTSVTSLCNVGASCGCCLGFLGGNIGTVIDGIIVVAATGFAVYALTRPETAAAFEANAVA